MSLTIQDILQPSLCHPSLGSSMVRASHQRSGCRFDSCLGLRNIFWVCESLSIQEVFLFIYISAEQIAHKIKFVSSDVERSGASKFLLEYVKQLHGFKRYDLTTIHRYSNVIHLTAMDLFQK